MQILLQFIANDLLFLYWNKHVIHDTLIIFEIAL